MAVLKLACKFFETLCIKKWSLCSLPTNLGGLVLPPIEYGRSEVMWFQGWFIKFSAASPCWLEYLLLKSQATMKGVYFKDAIMWGIQTMLRMCVGTLNSSPNLWVVPAQAGIHEWTRLQVILAPSHWVTPVFESSHLMPQILWCRDKPSLPCAAWIPEPQNPEE